MRDFLRVDDFSEDEILRVLDRADELRRLWNENSMPRPLEGMRIALWFHGQGFRNRVAFEIGARAMGADVSYVPGELGVHEPIEDIGHYLDNWFSMLVVRAKRREDLLRLAEDASAPLINARTDRNHPCEILGDLQFLRERRGSLEGMRVAFFGEVTNLCMSWFEAAVRLPIEVVQIAPEAYLFPEEELRAMNQGAAGRIVVSADIDSGVDRGTYLVYTDCWPKDKDAAETATAFLPYQVTERTLSRMDPEGCFLPCPPVTRGQEVSPGAMLSPLCRDYEAKDRLLHAQNAIMEFIAEGPKA